MTMGIVDRYGGKQAMREGAVQRTWFMTVNPRDLAEGDVHEILVGPIEEDGDTAEGFTITWSRMQGHVVARLGAYADSWSGMIRCSHLLRALPIIPDNVGVQGHPTIEQVVAGLVAAGCIDHTHPSPFPPKGERK